MHDVIIIGARAAGASLALTLVRQGLKVLLIDRDDFPSDTMSGHYIHPAGVAALRRIGAGDALTAAAAPPQRTVTVDFGPVVLSGTPTAAADGTVEGFAPRRYIFDPLLCAAAVVAGAEFLPGMSFDEPLTDDTGSVVGVAARNREGRRVEFRARLVVGADGKRSRVARTVGAAVYDARPATTCTFYSYFSGMDVPSTRLHVRDGHFCVATPTNDGLTFVAIAWPVDSFARIKADIDGAFRDTAAGMPWVGERLAVSRREERFTGTADLDAFFRVPHGPGWALVGDAGYHKDPITAQGMTDAFLHAELLAGAAVEGLSGRAPLEAALATYHARRDALARPLFDLTCDLARLAPPAPEMAAAIGAMAADPEATSRFLGVMSGTTSVADVFGPPPAIAA